MAVGGVQAQDLEIGGDIFHPRDHHLPGILVDPDPAGIGDEGDPGIHLGAPIMPRPGCGLPGTMGILVPGDGMEDPGQ